MKQGDKAGVLIQTLRHTSGRKDFLPLTEFDKQTLWYKKPVGRVTCPHCKRQKVLVTNPEGLHGNEAKDVLQHHTVPGTQGDCAMSRQTYFDVLDRVRGIK